MVTQDSTLKNAYRTQGEYTPNSIKKVVVNAVGAHFLH